MGPSFNNYDPEVLAQLFAQSQPAQPQMAPEMGQEAGMDVTLPPELKPGQFKDDPAGAVKAISQLMLSRNKGGQLTQSVPRSGPLGKLFLGPRQEPLADQTNYYDSLVGTYGKEVVDTILPGETLMTPEGKPHINSDVLTKLESLLPRTKQNESEKPNKAIGQAMLAKIGKTHGTDSPEYMNFKAAMDEMGGLAISKLGEVNAALGMPTKENDFVKGANGLMLRYNRASESYEPVPGQTTGILATLGDPAALNVFNGAKSRFDNDTVVKEYKKTIDALGNTSAILESDNPAGIGVLFSNIARSVGKEVGALNEGDIARAVGDPGYANTLYRWYNKKVDFFRNPQKGKLSDSDLKEFRGLFRDIAKASSDRYEKSVSAHVRSLKTMLPDLDEKFIRGAFDVAVPFTESKNRRLEGEATNYPKTGSIATATDYLSKFNKGKK